MFGNVRLAFGTILENLRKSLEGRRKSSENHQKRRHQHVYIIKRTLHGGLKIGILFSRGKTIFYALAALVRKILFCHSKIKFISSRHRVISSMYVAFYYIYCTWNTRPTNYTVSLPFKFVGEASSMFLSLSLKVHQF